MLRGPQPCGSGPLLWPTVARAIPGWLLFPECMNRRLWVFTQPLVPSHPHEVRSIFHRAADSDADAPTGQWRLAATWIDEPTDNLTHPGRVEPGAHEPRRQSDNHVFGSIHELAHPVSGPVADVLSIPCITAELETVNLGKSRVKSQ